MNFVSGPIHKEQRIRHVARARRCPSKVKPPAHAHIAGTFTDLCHGSGFSVKANAWKQKPRISWSHGGPSVTGQAADNQQHPAGFGHLPRQQTVTGQRTGQQKECESFGADVSCPRKRLRCFRGSGPTPSDSISVYSGGPRGRPGVGLGHVQDTHEHTNCIDLNPVFRFSHRSPNLNATH